MFRIDDATASPTLPTPEAALAEGYWTEGNPGTGTPATLERASWFNMVQEELRAIPVAAGLTPSKTTYNQILTALKSMFSSVVGSMRNAAMSVTTASATATFTADEIIVETALGGQTFRLASVNKTINLVTTGVGGMDTGTAPTSGFVALYAIYNPTTQTAALLATNAATLQPNVYGGVNMPAGYTASALVSVWGTNASKQFNLGFQQDRAISVLGLTALNSSIAAASYTALGLSGILPPNVLVCSGLLAMASGAATANFGISIASTVAGIGNTSVQGMSSAANAPTAGQYRVRILTPQTLYYTASVSSGTPVFTISVTSYEF